MQLAHCNTAGRLCASTSCCLHRRDAQPTAWSARNRPSLRLYTEQQGLPRSLRAGLECSHSLRPHTQHQRHLRQPHALSPDTAAGLEGLDGLRSSSSPARQPRGSSAGDGTVYLLALNIVVFVLDHLLHVQQMQSLYLWHAHPRWWQVRLFLAGLLGLLTER